MNAGAEEAAALPALRGASRVLDLVCPAVMGIINATPDSFSDGGRYADASAAIEMALTMVEDGARVIDVGGESTRPGAAAVAASAEIDRIVPVIEGLRAQSEVFISADTSKPAVMAAACAAGADMINDVTGLQGAGAISAVVQSGAAACLMHMQGEPRTMQRRPEYANVVADVRVFLERRLAACERAGIGRDRLCVDPGFGFGKTVAHNLDLMRELSVFAHMGVPLLIGVSRKSMFAKLFARDDMPSRINGSLAASFWAYQQGARIIRTHDVRATHQVLTLACALDTNRIN